MPPTMFGPRNWKTKHNTNEGIYNGTETHGLGFPALECTMRNLGYKILYPLSYGRLDIVI